MLKWAIVQEKLALGWAFVRLAERVDSEMHWVGRSVHLVSLFIRVIACAIFCHFPFPHEKCSAPFLSHFPLIPDPIIPLPKHPTWEANCRLWSPNRQRYALPNMLSLGKFQIVFLHYYSGYMLKWVSATPMGCWEKSMDRIPSPSSSTQLHFLFQQQRKFFRSLIRHAPLSGCPRQNYRTSLQITISALAPSSLPRKLLWPCVVFRLQCPKHVARKALDKNDNWRPKRWFVFGLLLQQ